VQVAHTALSHGSYTIEERLALAAHVPGPRLDGDDLEMVHEFLTRMSLPALALTRTGGALRPRRKRPRLHATQPVEVSMHEIAVGIGRLVCEGAFAVSLRASNCYAFSGQRTLGWLILAASVLSPAAWWLLKTR